MNLTQLALLKSRVQLNLIEDRHDAGFARDVRAQMEGGIGFSLGAALHGVSLMSARS